MKTKAMLAVLLAAFCIFVFSGCGDSRMASAEKLISGYFRGGDASAGNVSVLGVANNGNGYLATALYTGSGNHLLLMKIEKDESGAERLAAMCEGEMADAFVCSVNIASDGERTVLFGNFKGDAGKNPGYSKITFTMEDGSVLSVPIGSRPGYIAAVDGEQKIVDFTLEGQGEAGRYRQYLESGAKVIRASFVPVAKE